MSERLLPEVFTTDELARAALVDGARRHRPDCLRGTPFRAGHTLRRRGRRTSGRARTESACNGGCRRPGAGWPVRRGPATHPWRSPAGAACFGVELRSRVDPHRAARADGGRARERTGRCPARGVAHGVRHLTGSGRWRWWRGSTQPATRLDGSAPWSRAATTVRARRHAEAGRDDDPARGASKGTDAGEAACCAAASRGARARPAAVTSARCARRCGRCRPPRARRDD